MHSVCGAMCVYVVFVCDCCWVKIAKKLYKRQRMTMTTHGNTLCISKQKKEKHFHPFGCDAHSLCVCVFDLRVVLMNNKRYHISPYRFCCFVVSYICVRFGAASAEARRI